MRRTPALLAALTVAAAIGLSGCAGSPGTSPSASASVSASSAIAPDDCSPENLTTRSGGTLTLAVPKQLAPPYFVTDDPTKPDGDPASGEGYEAALLAELAKRLGFTASQISWLSYSSDYDRALDEADAAAGRIPITVRSGVEFTTPTLISGATIVVRDDSTATTADEAVSAGLGTVSDAATTALLTSLGLPVSRLSSFRSLDSAMRALDAGRINGLVLDDASAAYVSANVTGAKVLGTWGKQKADIGLALRSGDPLLQCLDGALASMTADGTLDELTSTWLAPVDAPVLAKGSSQ